MPRPDTRMRAVRLSRCWLGRSCAARRLDAALRLQAAGLRTGACLLRLLIPRPLLCLLLCLLAITLLELLLNQPLLLLLRGPLRCLFLLQALLCLLLRLLRLPDLLLLPFQSLLHQIGPGRGCRRLCCRWRGRMRALPLRLLALLRLRLSTLLKCIPLCSATVSRFTRYGLRR